MHTLIIKAHPRSDGFTHEIAKRYSDKQKISGHSVDTIELTDKENFQEYADFIDPRHLIEDAGVKHMQEKISKADEIVWIFPVWWMDAPAVMKNFWDRNFTSGFAFRYREDGKVDRLLKGKTTKVFTTAGGPGWIIGFLMGLIWKQGRFGFVGLKPTDFRILGNFPKLTKEQKEKFIKSL